MGGRRSRLLRTVVLLLLRVIVEVVLLLLLRKTIDLQLFLVNLGEGRLLKSDFHEVGLQLSVEGGRAPQDDFVAIEYSAAHLLVDSCLLVVLGRLTDFLHTLLLFHFYLRCNSANLK